MKINSKQAEFLSKALNNHPYQTEPVIDRFGEEYGEEFIEELLEALDCCAKATQAEQGESNG